MAKKYLLNQFIDGQRQRAIRKAFCFLLSALLVAAVPRDARAFCATPGKDGAVALTGIINSYFPGTSSAIVGQTWIPIGLGSGSGSLIAAGDLLLVIQMQDANINNANGTGYGANDGSGSGSNGIRSTGLYEYVKAVGVTTAAGNVTIVGTGPGSGLNNNYDAGASGAQGQRTYQVIRVPQYSNATLSSTLTCKAWDGSTGGVLAFDAAYDTNLNGAVVDVSGMGFQGGGAQR